MFKVLMFSNFYGRIKDVDCCFEANFYRLRESKYKLFIANGQFCLCKTMFGPFWELSILLKCKFDNLEI